MVRHRTTALLIVLCAICGTTAMAHVAPSVRENNRYLKLTVFGDQVRLAYIVYMGEIPGQRARVRLDKDRDGALSDAEANVFAAEMAARVQSSLTVDVDGKRVPVQFDTPTIGLGTPSVSGGAFSVDLVAWLCTGAPAESRTLTLVDKLNLPNPGETELRAEASPGLTLRAGKLQGRTGFEFSWSEHTRALEGGYALTYSAGADASLGQGNCKPADESGGLHWGLYVGGVGVLAALIATFVALRRRRQSA